MCNDLKCLDRNVKFPARCTNRGCSHSSHRDAFPLHELISKVIITPACTSDTMRKIDSYRLRPSQFKINNWEKAN